MADPTPTTVPTPTVTPTPTTTTAPAGQPVTSTVIARNSSGPAIASNIVTSGPTPTTTPPSTSTMTPPPTQQPFVTGTTTTPPAQQPVVAGTLPPLGSGDAFNMFQAFPAFGSDISQGFGTNFGGDLFSGVNFNGFFGSMALPPPAESVIGPDDRVEIEDTTAYPFRTIGRISIKCGVKKYVCTGTLIGPRLVLSAGHCAFTGGVLCEDLTFSPAQKGTEQPYGAFKVIRTRIPAKATIESEGVDFDSDYALLVLEEDIGNQLGWLSIGYTCSDSLHDLQTAGYPIDLNTKATTMYMSSCSNQVIEACPCGEGAKTCSSENTFNHECDTFGGMSGSAVWTIEESGLPNIRAIHVGGFAPSSTIQKNTAIYLNPTIFPFYM
eukprot:TRINITY_DN9194_c0_g1_i1.p1 TRINITY_DN9194_c0_g1~~TRINITY_DN9194_c0_g1_i1.p1  ORF type:complete len:428 (-),score=47.94 TRINITY_DN9194_c0_g1_i1:1030-2169(-)